MTREQLEQVQLGASAIARGAIAPPVTITLTRTRLAVPRVISPEEAELAFQPKVIELDTGR